GHPVALLLLLVSAHAQGAAGLHPLARLLDADAIDIGHVNLLIVQRFVDRPCRSSRRCSTAKFLLKYPAGFSERQARAAREEGGGIAVAEVAEEVRPDAPLGHYLRRSCLTGRGGEELLVHLCVVEAGHRPAVEAERARGEDEVSALQRPVAEGG